MTKHDDAVRRGAALLDERGPADWRDQINSDRLNLGSIHDCVLGQVYYFVDRYEPFDAGLKRLGAPMDDGNNDVELDWTFDHGFDDPDNGYHALTEAWRAYLTTTEES